MAICVWPCLKNNTACTFYVLKSKFWLFIISLFILINTFLSIDCEWNKDHLSVLYSNRAAAHMKNGDLAACVNDCTSALNFNPLNTKTLLRRARAQEELER